MTKFKTKTMLIEIKDIYGKILFSHECENNTLKKTVELAVKNKVYLGFANLSDANLSDANLRRANLRGANLSDANLSDANLRRANLSDANLSDADLSDANLRRANLRGANLSDANLSDANLRRANLSDANLSDADLRYANLSDANLRRADLIGADLSSACLPIYCKWNYSIKNNNLIKIGCKEMTIKDWDLFFNSEEEFETKRNTTEFKQIQAVYNALKSYLETLNN